MRLIDFYPSQGNYLPGDEITLLIELETTASQEVRLRLYIRHLTDEPILIEHRLQLAAGEHSIRMAWTPVATPAGYSAQLEVSTMDDSERFAETTAFDVLSRWTDFPRYGFLSDFSPGRLDPEKVLKQLVRFHINGLQFYDWQYRHDRLLAPTEEYIDPLGREMSLPSVRTLVDGAHRYGMAAMPYLAIYAASAEFWRLHPDWALYDDAGKPIPFGEDFLGLMDPSRGSPWSRHLLAEARRALQNIPFDGLHIDQYGEPRRVWNSEGQPVELPQAFVDFIQAASGEHPDKTVLFNAVGNWPIEALLKSAVGFLYIEVWPPEVEYRQLAEIVLNAVRGSQGKPVVIALYLPAQRPANNLLADAVIIACGGTRIELGEERRLLSDPYFPRHEEIPSHLYGELRRLSDFLVRDGEWLRPYTLSEAERKVWAEGELNPSFISTDDSILSVARRHASSLAIQLVNFSGLAAGARWDEAHSAPIPCRNVPVRVQFPRRPAQVLWDCPERTADLQPLEFEYSADLLTFKVPQIHILGLVVVHE